MTFAFLVENGHKEAHCLLRKTKEPTVEEATLRRPTKEGELSTEATMAKADPKTSFGPWMVAQWKNRQRERRVMKGDNGSLPTATGNNLNGSDP